MKKKITFGPSHLMHPDFSPGHFSTGLINLLIHRGDPSPPSFSKGFCRYCRGDVCFALQTPKRGDVPWGLSVGGHLVCQATPAGCKGLRPTETKMNLEDC